MAYRVPFVNAPEHYRRIKSEIDAALLGCLESGDLIQRRQLAAFEKNLAEFVGVKFAVGVNSGYHALALALLAAKVGRGDEVITVAHTFVASVSAIVHAGATPVLVDVGRDHNMDMNLVERAITPRTKAIMPVHLNGRLCDMEHLNAIAAKHKLMIIEDAAQALGATFAGQVAGSFGIAGCFSFYPFKMLGCAGDGGAVTTKDPEFARTVKLLRFNGEDRETGEYLYHGYTALLDNVQAAILDVKLPHLRSWIAHRRHIAALYHAQLGSLATVTIPDWEKDDSRYVDAFQNYVIRVPRRDALRSYLRDNGVETLVSWPKPMWKHAGLALPEQHLPVTEALCREVVSLPMSAETKTEHVEITCDLIRRFFLG